MFCDSCRNLGVSIHVPFIAIETPQFVDVSRLKTVIVHCYVRKQERVLTMHSKVMVSASSFSQLMAIAFSDRSSNLRSPTGQSYMLMDAYLINYDYLQLQMQVVKHDGITIRDTVVLWSFFSKTFVGKCISTIGILVSLYNH